MPGYPAHWEADVVLADGRPVHLRPIRPSDGPALAEFHRRLSPQSVYFRFFTPKPELSPQEVRRFTHVDYVDRVALVALAGSRQSAPQGQGASGIEPEVVGIGGYDRIDQRQAEVAFSIRDDLQGRGLGSVFLEHLAAAAREAGIARFTAEVLPSNARMLATFRQAGFTLSQHLEQDVIAVSFDIEPTAQSRAVIAAREHRAEARSLSRLLHPDAIAVVGASRRVGTVGHALLAHLVNGGYCGRVLAVHPAAERILGVPCVRSLADAPWPIDLAVVAVPAAAVEDVLRDAATAGVLGLVVVSGGFADAGPQGVHRQGALIEAARLLGVRIVGPNALGLVNTEPGMRMNASLVPRLPSRGAVGFFCQSGALGSSILERLQARGLGISSFVSAGNRADVSGNDLLQYWQDDDGTEVIAMYLESMGNARKFARLVRRIAPTKPVLMVGSPGAAVPSGHLARSSELPERAVGGLLAASGLLTLDRVDRMLDLAAVLSSQPVPAGRGVRIIGNSDALAVLAANAVGRHGQGSAIEDLELTAEPACFPRDASVSRYEQQVGEALADARTGAVLVIHVPPIEGAEDGRLLPALAAVGQAAGKPIVAVMQGRGPTTRICDGVPVFVDVEDAVAALASMTQLARWRRELAGEPEPPEGVDPERVAGWVDSACQRGDLALDPDAAIQLLAAAGLPLSLALGDPVPPAALRISMEVDPVYGPVVQASLDDPAALALGDVCARLAPMHSAQARHALASLQALPSVLTGAPPSVLRASALWADALHRISWLPAWAPAVSRVQVSGLHPGRAGARAAAVGVHLDPRREAVDPDARRMGG